MLRIIDLSLLWCLLPFIKFYSKFNASEQIWVIGGHGGKAYADNSAMLHQYIAKQTDQKILWITKNRQIFSKLKAEGYLVCMKNSLKARLYLLSAPVVIQSHGHSDFDSILGKHIKLDAMVIHINHCMKFIKAGQLYSPLVDLSDLKQVERIKKKLSRFDYVLASSEWERRNFQLSFPHAKDKILLGGGAHLDGLDSSKSHAEAAKRILYFPTWRDKCVKSEIEVSDVINELFHDQQLASWLEMNGYVLTVCSHINFKNKLQKKVIGSKIDIASPDRIVELLCGCEVFISDYSGTILDALYLDKPVVFFPFDMQAFKKCRHMFVDYKDFAFGPVANDLKSLRDIIMSEAWKRYDLYKEKRDITSAEVFKYGRGGYAKRSYKAIKGLLNGKDPQSVQ